MLSLSAVAGSSGAGCGVNSNGVVVKPDTHVSLCLGLTIAPFLFILGVGGIDELTILGKESGEKNVRTDYINPQVFELLLTALMPANRLALQLSLATGLRISDCLALRTDVLKRSNRPTITEKKTHKHRRVYIPQELRDRLLKQAGRFFVFEGRLDERRPRTRAAVYKDLRRVAKLYRLDGKPIRRNIAPHSARKIYAVQDYHAHHDMKRVQRLLNHSDEAVTMLYALADQLAKK